MVVAVLPIPAASQPVPALHWPGRDQAHRSPRIPSTMEPAPFSALGTLHYSNLATGNQAAALCMSASTLRVRLRHATPDATTLKGDFW